MRHNSVRNTEAKIMREVCRDVQLEPVLQPVGKVKFKNKGTTLAQNARLDISARGVWKRHSLTSDSHIRVLHPI